MDLFLLPNEDSCQASSVFLCKLCQSREQPVHFFAGVVMHEADSQDAAVLLDAEALGEIQCVEISVPGENSALAKEGRDFRRLVVTQAERQRGAALVKALCFGDAEDAHPRNGLQARDQASDQCALVLMCGAIRCLQRFAAAFHARVAVPAQLSEVIHGCANSSD